MFSIIEQLNYTTKTIISVSSAYKTNVQLAALVKVRDKKVLKKTLRFISDSQ